MKNYHSSLKEQRLSRGLTLKTIEAATGISNENLSRWENGKAIPGIEFCITLSQYYGITLDELLGLDDFNENTENAIIPAKQNNKAIAFATEYAELVEDDNFRSITKLCNGITPELRALVLGYLIGVLQSQGVNTQKILKY